jgi:hypothetical protein
MIPPGIAVCEAADMRRMRTAALFPSFFVCIAADAATSKFYPPDEDETGALRLAQVVELGTRDDILASEDAVRHLLDSGLKDADIKNGSVALAVVYCCHEPTARRNAILFYVPADLPVDPGDIVVVRMGRKASRKDPGTVNVATEIRERSNSPGSRCRWDPPNEQLWMRVLYCDWMPSEGWTFKDGLYKTWLKRPDNTGQL